MALNSTGEGLHTPPTICLWLNWLKKPGICFLRAHLVGVPCVPADENGKTPPSHLQHGRPSSTAGERKVSTSV